MSKRKYARRASLPESRGGWNRSGERRAEWPCEGSANGNRPVAPAGDPVRYQRGAHFCARARGRRREAAPIRVVPQKQQLLSQRWDESCFLLLRNKKQLILMAVAQGWPHGQKIASALLRLFFIALQSCKGPGRRTGRAAEATAAGQGRAQQRPDGGQRAQKAQRGYQR